MDFETLDIDFTQLDSVPKGQLLCFVTSHLFGLVNDVSRLRDIAREAGVFLVDDAAQAFGASRKGRLAGTLGDVGFYSLARGKAYGSVEGGLIVTDSDAIADAIRAEAAKLRSPSLARSCWLLLRMLAYAAFLNPRLYWIPNSLPFLKLGSSEFAPGFRTARLSRLSQSQLPGLVDKLMEINEARRASAVAIVQRLSSNAPFAIPHPGPDCQPSYIRFPLLAADEATRQRAVSRLWAEGIGASACYPSAICDIPGIGSYMAPGPFHRPKAEALSKRLFTVPTHAYMRQHDLDRMAAVLNGI
jgi:dTDP-4-amino-4,6-dideoxygalactose transaminase